MAQGLVKKLRIVTGTTVRTVNAPSTYASAIGELPNGARIVKGITKDHAFIHLFVKDRADLARHFPACRKALAPEGLLWISYPKGGKTDLTRDKGWEVLEGAAMQWLSSIAFDAEWSAFLVKNAPPKAQTKASKDYHAHTAAWADAKTKTVRVPDDLEAAFKKQKKARSAFDALSFTNRKEYVLWVVGAKREETRAARVASTVTKLLEGRKNPSEK